jgi:hypothetical protein
MAKKKPKVVDGGPWKGPTLQEWLARFKASELEKLADWGDR